MRLGWIGMLFLTNQQNNWSMGQVWESRGGLNLRRAEPCVSQALSGHFAEWA
jgi:hypothetical protein